MTTPIPGPPGLPLLGNINDLNPELPIVSLTRLGEAYGEIYKLMLKKEQYFICTQALMNEVCDEKRFEKVIGASLEQVRNGVGDGLFTAHNGEHNWEIAHRVLMPAFGPLSIRTMFDEMHDIATQLVVKWARFGPKEKIHVTDDFTRLTLDSIALCAMGTRFNSFYHEEMHPFVDAMSGFLAEAGHRAKRPALANYFMRSAQRTFDEDIARMRKTAVDLLKERRVHPSDKKDLLNVMINGRDPKTGEGLTDENIVNNMITFLIAGHETTSGLLSFLFYNLLKNPRAYQVAQREVDDVIGRSPITVEHMTKLPYIEGCLRETLRLTPTAPAITVAGRADGPDEVLLANGKYKVKKGDNIVCLMPSIHKDPLVFGPDPEDFRPERMVEEAFSKLPPNSWKPFGNGMRGCIGRPFAWQEAILTTAMLLQTFNFRAEDPGYQLKIRQTLTIKPKDFYMLANLRDHIDVVHLERTLHADVADKPKEKDHTLIVNTSGDKKPMTIIYGSNSGTCESLAQSLARNASGRGYVVNVDTLDSAVDKLPKDQPVILLSSSYEGQPPDNAAHFVEWLQTLEGRDKLKGINYAVYGCGNHDWVSTFHRVPKLLDSKLEANGATRIAETGLGDVARGDIFSHFDKWQDETLWPALGSSAPDDEVATLEIDIDTSSRRSHLRQEVKEAIVLNNELLSAPGEPEKRHVTFELPSGMDYKTGDYLAVLPLNNVKTMKRVLKWAKLPWDAVLTIKAGENTTLPTGHPMALMDILASYVELGQPATRKNVARIAASASDPKLHAKLLALADTDYDKESLGHRLSVLDILEAHPEAVLPFSEFLAMLPPMRIRQYSISSSPLAEPKVASITFSVLDSPAYSSSTSKAEDASKTGAEKELETPPKRYLGVASTYLSGLTAGEKVHVSTKPSHSFHPPPTIETTPLILLCAGTGIAPFRGFIQERSIQALNGRTLAPAYLFVGCRSPSRDALFRSELEEWEKQGVVKTFYAYSAASEESKGTKYVQDRLWLEREEMRDIWEQGAKVYVCGSCEVGVGVEGVVRKMYKEGLELRGKGEVWSQEREDEWFRGVKSERFASDVFA